MGRLQFLLVLASAIILGSKFHGNRDHISQSQILYFPFGRLLQLARLRRKYWTPPPHGIELIQRKTRIAPVDWSVSQSVSQSLGLMTRYLLLADSYGLIFMGSPL